VHAPKETTAPPPRNWNELAQAMAAHDAKLSALFLNAEEIEFAPPRIIVAFEKSFDADRAREKLADASRVAALVLGEPVRVEVRQGKGRAPSANQAEEQQERELREQRIKEAREHPARQVVLDTFGQDARFQEPDVD
jgi:hypothetical protein